MSGGQLTVIIDDQIRDKRFTQAFNAQSSISAIIEWLIDQHGLPCYNMAGNTIHYDVVRHETGETLEHQATLQQIGVLDGEEFQLASPEARLIWKLIDKLKDELEDYIKDKLEDLAKKKLEELKETLDKTKTKDPQAEKLMKKAAKSHGCSCLGLALVGSAMLLLVVIGILVLLFSSDDDTPSQPYKLGDDCWCEGPNFVCSNGEVERSSPECSVGVECWCEGPNLVCSDDTVQPDHPNCGRVADPPG